MRYVSFFSGIEAASVAWHPLGWEPLAYSEIDRFASAVLAHRFPAVPNHGDVTKHDWSEYRGRADLVVFGSPCQSFSVAGKRLGMDDPRGNLAIFGLRACAAIRPRWFVYENVPGLLSSNGGRDFGALLGLMGECGYGVAYRVLDAQCFGVPQRRRRVFVVGYLGDWRRAAAVLLEREGVRGNSSTGGSPREDVAGTLGARTGRSVGAQDAACGHMIPTDDVAKCRTRGIGQRYDSETETFVSALSSVRRLTPTECERLQGFPDGWTLVPYRGKPAADGPRYRAIGNSMAVPVMSWIGKRIIMVESIHYA